MSIAEKIEKLVKEFVVDTDDGFYISPSNDMDEELYVEIDKLLQAENVQFSVDYTTVFDSPGYDSYALAYSYIENGKLNSDLLILEVY